MDVATYQAELRHSYVSGGPGAIVSGLVWLIAGIVASEFGVSRGFVVLFFGGMMIFPLGTLIVRALFRRVPPSASNPGGRIVIETVPPMIVTFLAAWLLVPGRPDVVFPIAALGVGAHYFGFRTAYGLVAYWVLAAVMCAIGIGAIFAGVPSPSTVPYLIALIEVAFGLWLTWSAVSEKPASGAA